MKYPKIVEVLGRILYLIGKQGISDRRTQETAANSDILWNTGNFFVIVRQVTHFYLLIYDTFIHYYEKISPIWVQQVKMSWLALLQNTSIKYDLLKKLKK